MIHHSIYIAESKIKMKKMTRKQSFYQYKNFTECETSYLREIYNNIFAFLLGPASNKTKMLKNENETQILLNMYINFTQ